MILTRTATLRAVKIASIIIAIAIIVAYALWRSFNYARGPVIDIYEPADGSTATSTVLTISGRTERASDLALNGAMVSVDQQGNWHESIIVFPGLNIETFTAKDQFGRIATRRLRVVGTLPFPSHTDTASTTAQ